jgi:ABC-type bacteriocin/lantibiotic exporter with double-glycine peptidase domain
MKGAFALLLTCAWHPVQVWTQNEPAAHAASDVRLPSCGVASCFVLLRLHGLHASLEDMSMQLAKGRPRAALDDLTALELLALLQAMGLNAKAMRCNTDLPATAWPVPAILHLPPEHVRAWGAVAGHFVVLAEVREQNAVIIDASHGFRKEVPMIQLRQIWNGTMIFVDSDNSIVQRGIERFFVSMFAVQLITLGWLWSVPRRAC